MQRYHQALRFKIIVPKDDGEQKQGPRSLPSRYHTKSRGQSDVGNKLRHIGLHRCSLCALLVARRNLVRRFSCTPCHIPRGTQTPCFCKNLPSWSSCIRVFSQLWKSLFLQNRQSVYNHALIICQPQQVALDWTADRSLPSKHRYLLYTIDKFLLGARPQSGFSA